MLDSENDGFEQLLRDAPYIPDGGFTQKVVAQLPATRPRTRRRQLVLLTAFALAGVIFLYQGITLGINFAAHAPRVLSAANASHWASLATNPLFLAGGLAVVAALGWLSIRLLTYFEEHFG